MALLGLNILRAPPLALCELVVAIEQKDEIGYVDCEEKFHSALSMVFVVCARNARYSYISWFYDCPCKLRSPLASVYTSSPLLNLLPLSFVGLSVSESISLCGKLQLRCIWGNLGCMGNT